MQWSFVLLLLSIQVNSQTLCPSHSQMVPKTFGMFDITGKALGCDDANSDRVNWTLLQSDDPKNQGFSAVGRMMPGATTQSCTLTLIEPPGDCALRDSQKAMAITNGHCVGMNEFSDTVVRDFDRPQEVAFNNFSDTQSSTVTTGVNKVLYGTMQGYDIGIVQLNATYGELRAKGIAPKRIAAAPTQGQLTNAGFPSTCVDENKRFLRASDCAREGYSEISEGVFYWPHAFRSKCSVTGGSSGSALFNAQGEIESLLNTATQGSEQRHACFINTPCELNGADVSLESNMTYGFDVSFLHQCAKGCQFDAKLPNCPLPDDPAPVPAIVSITSSLKFYSVYPDSSGKFSEQQIKWGRAGEVDCNESTGYAAFNGRYSPVKQSLRTKEPPVGMYLFCVKGRDAAGKWQTSIRPVNVTGKR